jgi:hypothetical protein
VLRRNDALTALHGVRQLRRFERVAILVRISEGHSVEAVMHTSLQVHAVAVIVILLLATGCVKVTTGRYAIHGQDVDALWGPGGSGSVIEIGSTNAAEARRRLGEPLVRYEEPATDIFEAVAICHWIFYPWPVALANQCSLNGPRVLLRVDYSGGVVQRCQTAVARSRVIPGNVPPEVERVWPDLSQERPAAIRAN